MDRNHDTSPWWVDAVGFVGGQVRVAEGEGEGEYEEDVSES